MVGGKQWSDVGRRGVVGGLSIGDNTCKQNTGIEIGEHEELSDTGCVWWS